MQLYERYKRDLVRMVVEWYTEAQQSYNARLSAQERMQHRTKAITLMTQISQKAIAISNHRNEWNDLAD